MGTTLYLATDTKINGLELNNDRVFLAKIVGDHEAMQELCKNLKVPSLGSFLSHDPRGLAAFIEDPEELKRAIAGAAPIQWFDPADALPTIRSLKAHYAQARFILARGRKPAGKKEWEPVDRTDDLLREFDDLQTVLTQVAKHGARFRIYVGF